MTNDLIYYINYLNEIKIDFKKKALEEAFKKTNI